MFRWFVEYKFVAVLLSAPLPTLKLTAKFFLPEAVEQILEYLIHSFIHSGFLQARCKFLPPPPTYLHVYVLKCTPPLTSRCQTSSTVKWDHKARAAVLLDRLTDGWKDSCFQVRVSCVGCELCVPRETGPLWHIQLSLAYFPPVSVTVQNDEKPRYHRQICKGLTFVLVAAKARCTADLYIT